MLVLWILTLLTIMAGSFTLTMRRETAVISGITGHARAQAFAEAGVALAESMLIDEDPANRLHVDGRLYELAYAEARIRVRVLSELGKVDINQAEPDSWQKLLSHAPVDEDRQLRIADAIIDWIDADDEARTEGAESREYRSAGLNYQPPNRAFQSLEELRMVIGVDEVLYNWLEPVITIYSGRKQIDPNKATQELNAIFALEDQLEDMRPNDDDLFADDVEIPALGSGEAVTIISEAMAPDGATAVIKAVVKKGSGDGNMFQVLSWQSGLPGRDSLFAEDMDQ